MNRRKAIQRTSLIVGGMLAAPILQAVQGQALSATNRLAVSAEHEALLADLADVIIPTTATPGAKAARVEQFIVRVVRDCYETPEQEKFYNGLTGFGQLCQKTFGKPFADLGEADRISAVKLLTKANPAFFKSMRELTVTGYFSSKIGATQALAYQPIPGKLIGCMPLTNDQKTWAL
ncbi:gluconate 2-dehydrogenase subunit 3 family protein [Rudanella lutea]|uniref:gluconate 2-dehydrogenase subunit 3 family protein n=1 Tax=Rudanella lutea TaxID=451374 RepID=UPI00048431BB|nr:gluconate 2-dehydrogenase subunit 3 family protein [Rudanella lutea]